MSSTASMFLICGHSYWNSAIKFESWLFALVLFLNKLARLCYNLIGFERLPESNDLLKCAVAVVVAPPDHCSHVSM